MMQNLSLSDLQKLVAQFAGGAIGYADFRDQFVSAFGLVRPSDSGVESAINFIEVLCADFDEGDIDEAEFRLILGEWLEKPIIVVEIDGKASSAKDMVNSHARVQSGSGIVLFGLPISA